MKKEIDIDWQIKKILIATISLPTKVERIKKLFEKEEIKK